MSDTNRETSLLFSIRELEELERERVRSERATEDARRLAAESRERERGEGARREEARRLREEEERRRESERALHEEAARRAALELAATERVRAEVEARSVAELAAARRVHEVDLVRHRAAIVRSRYRWAAAASVMATLVVGGIATLLSSELRSSERVAHERATALARENEAHRRTASELTETGARVQALEAELAVWRARAETPPPPALTAHGPSGHRHHDAHGDTTPAKCTKDGDPLNGCLE
ncbi:MAG TPA: hypothetical protein VH062_27695 [Polyangiaceae bacterium]|jgi:colicin import membrane protein|nr:hypothetical protein [Polyangiaceae bacterium]